MDIQEIREKLDAILEAGDLMLNPPEDLASFIDKEAVRQSRTDQILSCLAEKEACFPVEGELPNNPFYTYESFGYSNAQQDMLKEGYKKVITLKEMMGE